jgi:tetratricopeptide (TPR) repeat protein
MAYDTSYAKAKRLFAQSLTLYRDLGDQGPAALVLYLMGHTALFLGDPDAAKYFQESLEIRRALGNQIGVAESLTGLGHPLFLRQPEKAEILRRECLAICRETGDPFTIALGLHYLGSTLTFAGKFAEAHSYYSASANIHNDLGARRYIADVDTSLGFIQVHLGHYKQARAQIQQGLELAREIGYSVIIGLSLVALGHAMLAMDAHTEAEQLLQEAVDLYRMLGQREWLVWALAWLGHAAYAQGKRAQARQHLHEALQTGDAPLSVILSTAALSTIALLLADQGEPARAVELYALASCYPYVANSRWFEDVAGRHIADAAAELPPDIIAAAREHGRARDPRATVKELLAELGP